MIDVSGVRSSWSAVLKKSAGPHASDAGPARSGNTVIASVASPLPRSGQGEARVDGVLQRRQEFEDEKGLIDHSCVIGGPAPSRGLGARLRHRVRVGGEHEHRQLRMGPPDRGRIGPGPALSLRGRLAVEDHAPRVVSLDRCRDLVVIGDGDVLITGFLEKAADELLEQGFILDEQHRRLRPCAVVAFAVASCRATVASASGADVPARTSVGCLLHDGMTVPSYARARTTTEPILPHRLLSQPATPVAVLRERSRSSSRSGPRPVRRPQGDSRKRRGPRTAILPRG